jgi:hypothetical protein
MVPAGISDCGQKKVDRMEKEKEGNSHPFLLCGRKWIVLGS